MSLTNYGENLLLEKIPNEVYVKLHTGDPGEEGTANGATEVTRKKVTLGSPSSGVRKTTTAAKWEGVSTTETYKYVSYWDAITAGNPISSGALTAEKAMTAGDNFEIKAEELQQSLD